MWRVTGRTESQHNVPIPATPGSPNGGSEARTVASLTLQPVKQDGTDMLDPMVGQQGLSMSPERLAEFPLGSIVELVVRQPAAQGRGRSTEAGA